MEGEVGLRALIGERVSVLLALPMGKSTVQGLLVDVDELTLKLQSDARRTKGRETLLMLNKVVAVQKVHQQPGSASQVAGNG